MMSLEENDFGLLGSNVLFSAGGFLIPKTGFAAVRGPTKECEEGRRTPTVLIFERASHVRNFSTVAAHLPLHLIRGYRKSD